MSRVDCIAMKWQGRVVLDDAGQSDGIAQKCMEWPSTAKFRKDKEWRGNEIRRGERSSAGLYGKARAKISSQMHGKAGNASKRNVLSRNEKY